MLGFVGIDVVGLHLRSAVERRIELVDFDVLRLKIGSLRDVWRSGELSGLDKVVSLDCRNFGSEGGEFFTELINGAEIVFSGIIASSVNTGILVLAGMRGVEILLCSWRFVWFGI